MLSDDARPDSGSGSILGVGILAGMLALAALLFPLAGVLTARHLVGAAADASALAAADVAAGIFPGLPCDAAARITHAIGVSLDACKVDDAVVTVRVNTAVFGLTVTASATAGPPGTNDR